MNMNQKGFVNIIVVGIIVAILVGAAGYLAFTRRQTIPPQIKEIPLTGTEKQASVDDKGMAECEQKVRNERNQCFRDLAITRKDSSLCENAGELKGVCLRYIAIFIKKDLNLCEKIPSGSLGASKEECRKTILFQLPETREACREQGGAWGRIGARPVEQCNLRTSDSGKACTDSSQCESACIGESISSTVGKCSEWRITVGCRAILQNGRVPGILCAD